jgi:hypothetical protein
MPEKGISPEHQKGLAALDDLLARHQELIGSMLGADKPAGGAYTVTSETPTLEEVVTFANSLTTLYKHAPELAALFADMPLNGVSTTTRRRISGIPL